jgi:hypothetical protein
MKVAKFVAHMQGKKVDSLISSKSLGGRSAAQGAAASAPAQGTDADPRAAALGKELQSLTAAIEDGESKISIGAKFLTRIKSWFSSDSYDTAIAKQAFSKIDASKQSVLLALAFEAAAAPESGNSGDVKTVLNFCLAADVKENAIVASINTIPDSNGRVEVFKALTRPDSDFKWANLLGLQPNEAKVLVLNLAEVGEAGAGCLWKLLEDSKPTPNALPEFADAEANKLAQNLAKAGDVGARCLGQLLEADRLKNLQLDKSEANKLALDLAKAGAFGAACLKLLLNENKLENLELSAEDAKELVFNLAAGATGMSCLRYLIDQKENKLEHLDLSAEDAKGLAKKLANAGPVGALCLRPLLIKDKLEHLQLQGTTTSAEAKTKALELLGPNPPAIEELKRLLEA